ncbi:MAG: TolC family protein [Bacteroidales bacterium]|jgi:outer membrane protein TolC
MKRIKMLFLSLSLISIPILCFAQQGEIIEMPMTLQMCLKSAMDNNHNIRKARYDMAKSIQAKKEVTGALLPQINGSANLNRNIQKTKFIMPNFLINFLPASMLGDNVEKYMLIAMGTNYSAGVGATLNQQVLNFPLFNAVDIAETVESMSELAIVSNEEDVISQTANLYYAIQATRYIIELFNKSISLMESMLNTMEVNYSNGLVKKVDYDRLKVAYINMITQKDAIKNGLEVQKNLLKLQMGIDMNKPIELQKIDFDEFESKINSNNNLFFELERQTSYKILNKQERMGQLQKKAAVYESFPVLIAMANYNYNGVSDEFFKGETNYWYPSSMVSLNLKIPIFSGLSRTSKVRQANYELLKIKENKEQLEQALNMSYLNAVSKLEDCRRSLSAQKENMMLAEDVFRISESNYSNGIASMSDVLNANSSLIQSQINYAQSLNNLMKSYIELRKANGTVLNLMEK